MLEFLRRQTKPIMTALAVIIIIAFVFWGTNTGNKRPGGQMSLDDPAFTIYGQEQSLNDKARFERSFQLAQQMGMMDFLRTLITANRKYQTDDRIPIDYALNLLVLRKELEKNGIRASDAEVAAEFKKLPAFQNQTTHQFDGNMAEMFIKSVGSLGMRESDISEIVRDWIGLKKLQTVVSGNYEPSGHIIGQFYKASYQTIKAASITFNLDTYKKTAEVKDDEIAKYYDQKKDEFKTFEKRAANYVFFEKPKVDEKNPPKDEDRRKNENDFNTKVDKFNVKVIAPGANFEEIAKADGMEVKTLPAFSSDAPPEAIKEEFELLGEIFRNDPKLRPVSDPVEGKNGYYVFRVTSVEAPKQQELKEVEAKIKETLTEQKAQEGMTKAANDARKSIEDAVKAGKKFEDAVKEQKLEAKNLPEFSPADPPKDLPNGREIPGLAEKTAAGQFTKPLDIDKGVMLVYVISKELRKREDSKEKRDEIGNYYGEFSQGTIFHAWFDKRKTEEKIDVSPLTRTSVASK